MVRPRSLALAGGLLVALGMLWPLRGAASWAALEDEALQASALIVSGTLLDIQRIAPDGQAAYTLGIIKVWQCYQGPTSPVVLLQLPEMPAHGAALHFKTGQEGLWLLRPARGLPGVYRADHPQRFVSKTEQGALLRRLRLKACF